jgi:hypothetical protein
MIIELIVWGIVIYIIYKFVFELVLPVSKAAQQMKDNLKKTEETQKPGNPQSTNTSSAKSETSNTDGEYIDYEEIK